MNCSEAIRLAQWRHLHWTTRLAPLKRSNCPVGDSICHLATNLTLIKVQHARQICPFVVKIIFRQIIPSQKINASATVASAQYTATHSEKKCSKEAP